jgi:hypothetical protein
MKHAYLIIAHNEFEVLESLLCALDDARNDIYIHFDRKLKEYPNFRLRCSRLYVLLERIDVRWGDVSMIEAEYALFEQAYRIGGYDYYHLLSGVDMPIKSQDYIHDLFDNHKGKEFIGYCQGDVAEEIKRKVQKYHLFSKTFKKTMDWRRCVRSACLLSQTLLGMERNRQTYFKKGPQWVSITNEFVGYLLTQKRRVLNTYRLTCCSDEIFVQTLCWNSPFRDKIFNRLDEWCGCMRKINWQNNRLLEWEEKDYDELMQSESLFARKFSRKHLEVVKKILCEIGGYDKDCNTDFTLAT